MINPKYDFTDQTSDGGHIYRLSRCILLAHEDKSFQGALVASMSIPWGETKNDADLGGYHLVWTRDLVQSATDQYVPGTLLDCAWPAVLGAACVAALAAA